jgi:very-short-patch-repair endonuclease
METATTTSADSAMTREGAGLGIRVLRLTNLEVMQTFEGVCAKIQDALEAKP